MLKYILFCKSSINLIVTQDKSYSSNSFYFFLTLFPLNFQVAFITYDRSVQFYAMPEGASQPTQLTVSDVDGMFLSVIVCFTPNSVNSVLRKLCIGDPLT